MNVGMYFEVYMPVRNIHINPSSINYKLFTNKIEVSLSSLVFYVTRSHKEKSICLMWSQCHVEKVDKWVAHFGSSGLSVVEHC
jgi:hypothetical protein